MFREPFSDVFAQLLDNHLPTQAFIFGYGNEMAADENPFDKWEIVQFYSERRTERRVFLGSKFRLVAAFDEQPVGHKFHDRWIGGHFCIHIRWNCHDAKVTGDT